MSAFGTAVAILGVLLTVALTYALVIPVFDVVLDFLPAWATLPR